MSITITWSQTSGGDPITDPLNHGDVQADDEGVAQTVYIKHDGDNPLTDVGLYIRQCTAMYTGSFSPLSDFKEILSWGDETEEDDFGGFLINFLAKESFPSRGWATYSNKDVKVGSVWEGTVHRTGVGDTIDNAILLPTSTHASAEGELQNGATTVHFQVKVKVPKNETEIGYRQWDQILRFNYTS